HELTVHTFPTRRSSDLTDGRESFGKIGRNERMYAEYNPIVLVVTFQDLLQICLDLVYQYDGGLHFGTDAVGVLLTGLDVHFGTCPLSCDLHKSKFTGGQNLVFCAIVLHFVPKVIEQFSP